MNTSQEKLDKNYKEFIFVSANLSEKDFKAELSKHMQIRHFYIENLQSQDQAILSHISKASDDKHYFRVKMDTPLTAKKIKEVTGMDVFERPIVSSGNIMHPQQQPQSSSEEEKKIETNPQNKDEANSSSSRKMAVSEGSLIPLDKKENAEPPGNNKKERSNIDPSPIFQFLETLPFKLEKIDPKKLDIIDDNLYIYALSGCQLKTVLAEIFSRPHSWPVHCMFAAFIKIKKHFAFECSFTVRIDGKEIDLETKFKFSDYDNPGDLPHTKLGTKDLRVNQYYIILFRPLNHSDTNKGANWICLGACNPFDLEKDGAIQQLEKFEDGSTLKCIQSSNNYIEAHERPIHLFNKNSIDKRKIARGNEQNPRKKIKPNPILSNVADQEKSPH